MANLATPRDVVQLALQIEINGSRFYNFLLTQAKDRKVKDLFTLLAKQEAQHIKVFQEMLDALAGEQKPTFFTEEYFINMSYVADGIVFTREDQGEALAKSMKSIGEAAAMALKFEKDALVFYEGVKKLTSDDDQQVIDMIIGEEQKHVEHLTELKKLL
jgi:rubrerythrin